MGSMGLQWKWQLEVASASSSSELSLRSCCLQHEFGELLVAVSVQGHAYFF